MSTFISQVFIALAIIILLAIILAFILRKRKRSTHFQSKIVNDTSYNIAGIEDDPANADSDKVDDYLSSKNQGDAQPFNRGDYEAYNDKV